MASTSLDARHPDIFKINILGEDSIHCGVHLIPYIVDTVVNQLPASTYVTITDSHLEKLWLPKFADAFSTKASNARFLKKIIPPGEQVKSRKGKADIEDFLLAEHCTRDTVLLALGGGVVGDLVGFVAATFMRGVRFVQIPTTLLAMVDSSVGGKTAIDTPHGKNLIGAFWQPKFIFIDCAFLTTLPEREFANGMAEVIKTAAIWNEKEFITLETKPEAIRRGLQHLLNPLTKYYDGGRTVENRFDEQFLLLAMVAGSVRVKAEIVTQDPHEKGLRNLVNFGHTVGHAIEALVTPDVLHGECVAVGMILEAEIARHLGVLSQVTVGRLTRVLKQYNLPVSLNDKLFQKAPGAKDLTIGNLLDKMRIDKKNQGNEKRVVLLSKVGKTHEMKATSVEDPVIEIVLAQAVKVIAKPPKDVVMMATPGSKSITNRALLLAALGKGTCKLRNMLHSDDTQVMMTALKELHGAEFSWDDDGETIVVKGGGGIMSIPTDNRSIWLGNAGTAARFLTTVCTLVRPPPEALEDVYVRITGNERMKQRPIAPLVTALRANGCKIKYMENEGTLPLAIDARGGLDGGWIHLEASVSSQYVSSILLCAPYAQAPVTLVLTGGQVISQPYIDMTIAIMAGFGINVRRRKDEATGALLDIYDIPRGVYTNPEVYDIESDASSATYPLAIAAITGTKCTIETIGTSSLQGDAKFAKEVLEKMGCTVEQSESQTTVQGPPIGQLKAIEEVDMEEMTDAFLTATVLAAVAKENGGKTRIVGIANQRVKECNRIQAMIDQLAKFGVFCRELETGLEIYAENIQALKKGASIHCYDDHRVAMAFSVLAAIIPDTIIEEKRCVEKTWPNWWDDLRNKIGVSAVGVEQLTPEQQKDKDEKEKAAQPPPPIDTAVSSLKSVPSARPLNPKASVFLIGMRGSGKSFVAEHAARELGWPHVDADVYFEEKYKIGVREYVTEKGWPAFRDAETAVLEELLEEKVFGHVISLGGGVVESPLARELLVDYSAKKGPVVHIHRDIDDIIAFLATAVERPAYGEPILDVYNRREPLYEVCANFEFVNQVAPAGDAVKIKAGVTEIGRFFKHITGQKPNLAENLERGERTYFLSLTYPDLTGALSDMEELSIGVDALELRADLLKPLDDTTPDAEYVPSVKYVKHQLAALRRSSQLPTVFTVRTKPQGGKFPDNKPVEALKILQLALRLGVEYLDVEISLPEKVITILSRLKSSSKIIASWHDWSGAMKWDGADVKQRYEQAAQIGDVIKIVGKADTLQDNFELQNFASARSSGKPLMAINMGEHGQLSRIVNKNLTPVTHPLLPSKAAPGQLSFVQIQQGLHLIGQLTPKKFYLFGTPIAHSLSPTLHNTGFSLLGLPHHYERFETPTVGEEIKLALAASDFGGASVTIPHKLDIIPLLDKLSPAASLIGAVNSIIPQSTDTGRILLGDNTDWLGIRAAVSANFGGGIAKAALVIGGGGTARAALYALHQLGAEPIYLFNRTREKAKELAEMFVDAPVVVVDSLGEWAGDAPNVIVSTVPAYNTTTEEEEGKLLLPQSLFAYQDGPAVVVDMAYKPAETPLLHLAKSAAPNWATVPGIQVLLEQGYWQFEYWTNRRCPRRFISKVVLKAFEAS